MSIETLFSSNIIVPIIVAFIGFLIAVTTAVIAKEHKVSEFRQAWIDALREDAAELYALMLQCNHNIYHAYKIKFSSDEYADNDINPPKTNEMLKVFNDKCTEATVKAALIRFRLNPESDKDYINSIFSILKDMSRYNMTETTTSLETINKDLQRRIHVFSTNTHLILKREWERVKQGENRYIMFVTVGEFFGATFIVAFYVLLALVKFPEYFPGIFN
jgi:hypothetical protein